MKDRNGKTLRKGDVCVVFDIGNDDSIADLDGAIVEFLEYENDIEFCARCSAGFSPPSYFLPDELEKIGDVR